MPVGGLTLVFSEAWSSPRSWEVGGTGVTQGKVDPCVVTCTGGDHGVLLARAVLTVPCGQDLGKQYGLRFQ